MRTLSASVTNHPPQLSLGRNIVFFLPLFIYFLHSLIVRPFQAPIGALCSWLRWKSLGYSSPTSYSVALWLRSGLNDLMITSCWVIFFVTIRTVCHQYKPIKGSLTPVMSEHLFKCFYFTNPHFRFHTQRGIWLMSHFLGGGNTSSNSSPVIQRQGPLNWHKLNRTSIFLWDVSLQKKMNESASA